ncbi:MAG: HypC/HybG/HupF family hydrogenase formation chaperone [Bacteroidales bacterium]|nr:HypC/HybG/HupF family hydrogenase formation chaperone [Bacteroidales bacterium]
MPAKVIEINGDIAKASVGGTIIEAGLHMLDDVQVGDYILVHTGFALQKISEEEAEETLKLFKEYEDFNEMLDDEENKKL